MRKQIQEMSNPPAPKPEWNISQNGNPYIKRQGDDIELHAVVYPVNRQFTFRIRETEDSLKRRKATPRERKPFERSYPTVDAAKAAVEESLQKMMDAITRMKLIEANKSKPDNLADAQPVPVAKKPATPAKTPKETRQEFLDRVRKKTQEMSNPPAKKQEPCSHCHELHSTNDPCPYSTKIGLKKQEPCERCGLGGWCVECIMKRRKQNEIEIQRG